MWSEEVIFHCGQMPQYYLSHIEDIQCCRLSPIIMTRSNYSMFEITKLPWESCHIIYIILNWIVLFMFQFITCVTCCTSMWIIVDISTYVLPPYILIISQDLINLKSLNYYHCFLWPNIAVYLLEHKKKYWKNRRGKILQTVEKQHFK